MRSTLACARLGTISMATRIGLSFLPRGRSGRNYVEAVEAAAGQAIPLATPDECPDLDSEDAARAWLASRAYLIERLRDVDALLLTGGADVAPSWYGEPVDGSEPPGRSRDHLEMAQITFALDNRLPILGICRGAQVLNVAFGGSLVQDLPSRALHAAADGEPSRSHPVRVAVASRLAGILDSDDGAPGIVGVNSRHHQAATLERLGARLVPTAISQAADAGLQVVEAFETLATAGDDAFVVGVQWHPERLSDPVPAAPGQRGSFAEQSLRLFQALVEAARRR